MKQLRMSVLTLGLIAGCGSFDDSVSEFEPTPQELDDIQRREMIRIQVSGATQEVPADTATGLAATIFTSRCFPHYTANVQFSPAFVNSATPAGCTFADLASTTTAGSCDVVMCRAHTALCISHSLLDIVNSPTASVFGTTTVPPQPATARAELTRTAAKYAQLALLHSGTALQQEARDLGGVCASASNLTVLGTAITSSVPAAEASGAMPGAPTSTGNPVTYNRSRGEILASTFVDAYELVRESATEVQEEMLAVADSQTAERSDEARAALYTQTGPLISRGTLAETLVGYAGRAGLFTMPGSGVASAPLCRTETGTDPGIAAAIGILRGAGLRPDVIRGSADLDTLLVGSVTEGNVRDRIFETTGYQPPTPVTSSAALLQAFSVTRPDMLRAREIMIQEHSAFDRSARIDAANRVDSQTGPGGVALAYPRYASTSRPPSQVPAAFWAASAREIEPLAWGGPQGYQVASQDRTSTADALFAPNATVYAPRNTATLLDWAYSVAYDAVAVNINSANGLPGWPTTLPGAAVDPVNILRAHLMSASVDHQGRGEVCYRRKDASTEQYQVRLYTDVPAAAIRVVRGTDGLRCATTGYVDGTRCSMSTYEAAAPTSCTPTPTTSTGFSQCLQWGTTAGMQNVGNATWYFVTPVGDRGSIATGQACTFGFQCLSGACAAGLCSGTVPPTVGTNNPGSFRALGGVRLPSYPGTTYLTTTDWQFCRETPFIASIDEMVRQAMERDPDDCTEAATSCSGLSVNQLLPLENELISNSNQYEDSWRHYLDLAAREAAHADELADAIINNGINADERQERAADELERACGPGVTLNGIFDTTLTTFVAPPPRRAPSTVNARRSTAVSQVAANATQSERCKTQPSATLTAHASTNASGMLRSSLLSTLECRLFATGVERPIPRVFARRTL